MGTIYLINNKALEVAVDKHTGIVTIQNHVPILAEAAKSVAGAAAILMKANPMPMITSRVCAHFCHSIMPINSM